MQFLIDEDLPYSVKELLQKYKHEAVDIRDINFRGSMDYQVAAFAQKRSLCLVTGDFDFSDVRNYPPGKYSGIIVLKLPKSATARYILDLLESFIKQNNLVNEIPGKLAIVEPGRIRIRKG